MIDEKEWIKFLMSYDKPPKEGTIHKYGNTIAYACADGWKIFRENEDYEYYQSYSDRFWDGRNRYYDLDDGWKDGFYWNGEYAFVGKDDVMYRICETCGFTYGEHCGNDCPHGTWEEWDDYCYRRRINFDYEKPPEPPKPTKEEIKKALEDATKKMMTSSRLLLEDY
jgi:hypothetical protein